MSGNPAIDATLARFGFYSLARHTARPTADALRQQAAQADITLPEAFITFSAEHGAGAFEQRVGVHLPAGCPLGPAFIVDILYAAGAPEDWDALALRDDTYDGRLPLSALPIATDPGGNLLLLAPESGAIYAWDHEHLDLDDTALDRMVANLAADGVPVDEHDIDQLVLMWEERHPGQVANPTGHGNLYPVAESYEALLGEMRVVG